MFKKVSFFLLLFFSINAVSAQKSDTGTDPFYVNIFISADKTIYVETEKSGFDEVEDKVSELIRNKPFKLDQKIIYRIFADENLDLGYIIDVNREMLSAYKENVFTRRFLLNTMELNIDGQDWFDSVEIDKIERS